MRNKQRGVITLLYVPIYLVAAYFGLVVTEHATAPVQKAAAIEQPAQTAQAQ